MEGEGHTEEQAKLSRQLKGLLNRYVSIFDKVHPQFIPKHSRMSEQNIASIVDATEELYRSHRRHGMLSSIVF